MSFNVQRNIHASEVIKWKRNLEIQPQKFNHRNPNHRNKIETSCPLSYPNEISLFNPIPLIILF